MQPCDPLLIGAYFDGELDDAVRRRVDEHLSACSPCAQELEALRSTSRWIDRTGPADVSATRLFRIHTEIDRMSDGAVWRLGATIGAIAASILVVAATWLSELPPPRPHSDPTAVAVLSSPPAWEQAAMTLRVEPLTETDQSVRIADAHFTDFMLEGLLPEAGYEKKAN